MLKKQSKKLAILLVLSMIASLFVGVSTASAANGVAVSVSRVLSAKTDEGYTKIGNIQIKEDSDYPDAFATGDTFIVTLPSGLKWDNLKEESKIAEKGSTWQDEVDAVNPDYPAGSVKVDVDGRQTMTVSIKTTDDKKQDTYAIPLYVQFDGVEEGYAYATIDGMDSPVPSGDYAVANVLDGGTTATATSTFTAGPDTPSASFEFRIIETTTGTLASAKDTVTLTLPKDVEFTSLEVKGEGGFSGSDTISIDTDNAHKAKFALSDLTGIDFTANSGSRGILQFKAKAYIGDDMRSGAVNLDIEGTDKVDDATIKVGTVADYGVAVNAEDPTTVLSGRVCAELGTIIIYENVKETLTLDRTVKVELPDGVQFAGEYKSSDLDVTKGGAYCGASVEKCDEDSVTIKLSKKGGSSDRVKLEIPMKYLNIRADFVGDIVATISGRAGAEGEVVIGTVVSPVEVAVANIADVKIGYQAQALSDVTITEVEAGAMIEKGEFRIELPAGVEFQEKEVDVEVTEGNMEIKSVKVKASTSKENAYVSFVVDSESSASQPSTVTISGLYLDVDRTVAEGPIKAIITGDAVAVSDELYVDKDGKTKTLVKGTATDALWDTYDSSVNYGSDVTKYMFDDNGEFGRFNIANCVTPGVGETTSTAVGATSTFVIGSTAAVIAGADSVMPVAPYISNSRTLLPVRYVAYACGVPEANVIWNPDNQTVTLLNNNGTVVQLTIGSATMQVNGVPVIMDVAPQITNGYTFLPARYVANAFGYDAAWEAATQTVTISPVQ